MKGERMHMEWDSNGFKKFIQRNNIIDLHTSNGIFTLNNKRGGAHQIASRLDRFLITKDIICLGGNIDSTIIPMAGYDHWPIELQ